MSDYNGPSEKVRVRFTREWYGVRAGTVVSATKYPELGTYYVPVLEGCHIGEHPSHVGLLEELPTARDWLMADTDSDGHPWWTPSQIEDILDALQPVLDALEQDTHWKEDAAMFARNADFYRGLVVQIGEKFGAPAFTSDDGSVQDAVLVVKVPELVEALRQERDDLVDCGHLMREMRAERDDLRAKLTQAENIIRMKAELRAALDRG